MSLAASMAKFKSELSDATSRNASHSRPQSTAPQRTSTPAGPKRALDTQPQSRPSEKRAIPVGGELMTHVVFAQDHLKEKFPSPVTFEDILAYLSLPVDLQKHKALIKRALQDHHRVTYIPKTSSTDRDTFRYNPIHPVASTQDLLAYLQERPTVAGISVKELKDVWPDCVPELDKLEQQHKILIVRNKKDDTPRTIWADDPTLRTQPDTDFVDFWARTRLPGTEDELRNELEKAHLTPTSQVKEIRKVDARKKEKRRVNRASGKVTNTHMRGILKDYSRR